MCACSQHAEQTTCTVSSTRIDLRLRGKSSEIIRTGRGIGTGDAWVREIRDGNGGVTWRTKRRAPSNCPMPHES